MITSPSRRHRSSPEPRKIVAGLAAGPIDAHIAPRGRSHPQQPCSCSGEQWNGGASDAAACKAPRVGRNARGAQTSKGLVVHEASATAHVH